jgi:hypothetical protein
MDFASTQARAKGVTPTATCEEGHTEAVAASPPKASPPPTADGVDRMYLLTFRMQLHKHT